MLRVDCIEEVNHTCARLWRQMHVDLMHYVLAWSVSFHVPLPIGNSVACSGADKSVWSSLCCAGSCWVGSHWGMSRKSLEAVIRGPLTHSQHLAMQPRSFQHFWLFSTDVHPKEGIHLGDPPSLDAPSAPLVFMHEDKIQIRIGPKAVHGNYSSKVLISCLWLMLLYYSSRLARSEK